MKPATKKQNKTKNRAVRNSKRKTQKLETKQCMACVDTPSSCKKKHCQARRAIIRNDRQVKHDLSSQNLDQPENKPNPSRALTKNCCGQRKPSRFQNPTFRFTIFPSNRTSDRLKHCVSADCHDQAKATRHSKARIHKKGRSHGFSRSVWMPPSFPHIRALRLSLLLLQQSKRYILAKKANRAKEMPRTCLGKFTTDLTVHSRLRVSTRWSKKSLY
jgi:hypothetical protein